MEATRWITRRLLFDWQQPDFLPEVTLDVERFVDKAVEVGAQSLDVVVKSAFGNCLYPSRVGRTNRAMKGDIFGSLCTLARKRGLEVFAYFNMLLDDELGAEHPEWLQRDAAGEPLKFESYAMLCMNAAPYRDYVYAHLAEIADLHPVNGIMLDIQYWHGKGCYCASCRERFRAETGGELEPGSFTPDRWHELYACQCRWRREYILGAVERVGRIRPGLQWVWNASGSFSDNTKLDERLSHYGTEAHPPAYDWCSAKAKWIRASGKPFVQWMPESIGSWGHFSLTTPATLKATYNTSLLGPEGEEREDFLLCDVLGVRFCSYSPYSLCYVDGFQDPLAGALPELPLLIKDVGYQENSPHRPIYCELRGQARALATFTEPILESDWARGRHIYHDHAPPGKRTSRPAVVVNPYGKGMAAFLPFPFIQAHEFQANPWYRSLMSTVLSVLGVPRRVRIRAPDGVLSVATESDSGWLLHLINARKETGSILIDDSVEAGPVSLELRPPWPVSGASLPLRGQALELTFRHGALELTVESVRDHEIVEIARA